MVVLLEKDLVVIDLAQNGWAWLLNKSSLSLNVGQNGTIYLLELIIFNKYYLYIYTTLINALILGSPTNEVESDPVCALLSTVTPYSRTPILWLSTSLLWPAVSTLPTALWTSYLHFTLLARGRNDRGTAKRSYIRKLHVLTCHIVVVGDLYFILLWKSYVKKCSRILHFSDKNLFDWEQGLLSRYVQLEGMLPYDFYRWCYIIKGWGKCFVLQVPYKFLGSDKVSWTYVVVIEKNKNFLKEKHNLNPSK